MGTGVSARPDASIFYSYPAELIAAWCEVSVATARAWKKGSRAPSPTAIKLFRLYAEERVLTEEFAGFTVVKDKLVPAAGRPFTRGQLEAYGHVYQLAVTYARAEVEGHLDRMGLAKREQPPLARPQLLAKAPVWISDPFFDPREQARVVVLDAKDDRRI